MKNFQINKFILITLLCASVAACSGGAGNSGNESLGGTNAGSSAGISQPVNDEVGTAGNLLPPSESASPQKVEGICGNGICEYPEQVSSCPSDCMLPDNPPRVDAQPVVVKDESEPSSENHTETSSESHHTSTTPSAETPASPSATSSASATESTSSPAASTGAASTPSSASATASSEASTATSTTESSPSVSDAPFDIVSVTPSPLLAQLGNSYRVNIELRSLSPLSSIGSAIYRVVPEQAGITLSETTWNSENTLGALRLNVAARVPAGRYEVKFRLTHGSFERYFTLPIEVNVASESASTGGSSSTSMTEEERAAAEAVRAAEEAARLAAERAASSGTSGASSSSSSSTSSAGSSGGSGLTLMGGEGSEGRPAQILTPAGGASGGSSGLTIIGGERSEGRPVQILVPAGGGSSTSPDDVLRLIR